MLVGMDASRSDRAWLATRVGPEVKHFLAVGGPRRSFAARSNYLLGRSGTLIESMANYISRDLTACYIKIGN